MNRREEMREMRAQGYTYREIGEAFGVAKQRAYYLINKAKSDDDRCWSVFTKKQWLWVADRRNEGYTLAELGDFLGVTQSTVCVHSRVSLSPLKDRKAEFCALAGEQVLEEKAGGASVYSPAQWDWIDDRYAEGYPAKALAKFLELCEQTVHTHCTPRRERRDLPPLESRKDEFNRLG